MKMDEKHLLQLLAAAKSQNEYDRLIDKYVFKIDKKNRNTKLKRGESHNMLTANQMTEINKKEKPYDFTKPWM
jgi:hypothetical protein